MRAAGFFRQECLERGIFPARVEVDLKGSLAATGRGHHSDLAILAGLHGWDPETCDIDALQALPATLAADPVIPWGEGETRVDHDAVRFLPFREYKDEALPHANTAVFRACSGERAVFQQTWISVGGGFVRPAGAEVAAGRVEPARAPRCPFHDCTSLVAAAAGIGGTLGDVVLANEADWEDRPGETAERLDRVWAAFNDCIARGLAQRGELPGGLGVKRRAAEIVRRIESGRVQDAYVPVARAQAYAFAVNEENAAGGRVVTAPTNGAAGVVAGVLVEAAERMGLDRETIHNALATAGAVGMLVKAHASISGAEVGCQGEVGTATAMAAAALCQILGENVRQVENAAEIAIEHNLGLTCDPIRGLVQAPCIERNAMGVAKAWSAAQLALHSVVHPVVSLDRVIRVMKRTGDDMRREYKETSEGGLAVSLPEC
jgi:L-serine dehydratase